MIIIPSYEKLKDGWICYYDEVRENVILRRFLGPDGWARGVCYWPDSQKLERHFQTWNQVPLPIEDWEYEQEVEDRKYCEQMRTEEFYRMMDEHFAREDERRREQCADDWWASTLSDMRKHMS